MEFSDYLRFVVALVFVLGLIGVLTVAARKMGFGHNTTQFRGQAKRLGIVEIMPLDARRKMVLVRRDDKEHLVILGPGSETLIESGIDAALSDDTSPDAVSSDDVQDQKARMTTDCPEPLSTIMGKGGHG